MTISATVTRRRWPPETPRRSASPTIVSATWSMPKTFMIASTLFASSFCKGRRTPPRGRAASGACVSKAKRSVSRTVRHGACWSIWDTNVATFAGMKGRALPTERDGDDRFPAPNLSTFVAAAGRRPAP